MPAKPSPLAPRWAVTWVVLGAVMLSSGAGCLLVTDDQRVTVSGIVTYAGWGGGDFLVGLFTQSEWSLESAVPGAGRPFASVLVPGWTSSQYSLEIDAHRGPVVVGAFNDTDGDRRRDSFEPSGFASADVGSGDITVNVTLTAP